VFVRTTVIQADPAKIDEGIDVVRERVFPAVSDIDGNVGMSLFVSRETGRCIACTAWQSQEAMQRSADQVIALRDEATQALGSATSEVMQWEVAVVHRDHSAPEGACARITWLTGIPDTAERAADVYRMAVLPRIQEFDGFCSASLFVSREAGRAVGTLTFDSREALEATRDSAKQIREAASREMGATVDQVEEMEVAFAHLHVPEMA
jgi:heme-degrading monooxygenase HmoA